MNTQNELRRGWKELEQVGLLLAKRAAEKAHQANLIPSPVDDGIDWKARYEAMREAYIKTRLEVSGSFGNWSGDTRRRVLEHEISMELGFTV
jgi:hypothetical protein